jgi:hypothetical protein
LRINTNVSFLYPPWSFRLKQKFSFENLNATEPDPKVQSNAVCAEWFERFKGRHWFHNLKLRGKAVAAALVADHAARSPASSESSH